jgi:hypothetical protein
MMSLPPPLLASASDDEVSLWQPHADAAEALVTFAPHSEPVTCLRWTSNDRILASGARDGTVALSEASGALFHTLEASSPTGATVAILALTWSPGSRYLAAAGSDAVVRIFDLQKRSQALVLRGHRAAVRGVAWSPSEVYVASSSDAGEVVVHRVQGSVAKVAKVEHPPSAREADGGNPPALGALQWAPFHPSLLAVGAADGSVAVWSIRPSADSDLTPQHVFNDHAGACTGLQWSPVNQHLLASCSSDAMLLFYDVTKQCMVRTIRLQRALTAMSFASSGVHLAAGTGDGELLVFDLRLETPEPAWTVQAHDGPVRALAFQRSAAAAAAGIGASAASPRLAASPAGAIPPSDAAAAAAAAATAGATAVAAAAGYGQSPALVNRAAAVQRSATNGAAGGGAAGGGAAGETADAAHTPSAYPAGDTPASRRAKPRALPPSPPHSASLPRMSALGDVSDDSGGGGADDDDFERAVGDGGGKEFEDGGEEDEEAAEAEEAYEDYDDEYDGYRGQEDVQETYLDEEDEDDAEMLGETYGSRAEDAYAYDDDVGEEEAGEELGGEDEGSVVESYMAQHQRASSAARPQPPAAQVAQAAQQQQQHQGASSCASSGGSFGPRTGVPSWLRGRAGCDATTAVSASSSLKPQPQQQGAPPLATVGGGGARPQSADAACKAPPLPPTAAPGAGSAVPRASKLPAIRPSPAERSPACLPPSMQDSPAATQPADGAPVRPPQEPRAAPPSHGMPPPRAVWAEAPGSVELRNRPVPPQQPPVPPQPEPALPAPFAQPAYPAPHVSAGEPHGGGGGGMLGPQGVLSLEGMFFDLRAALQEDVRGLHLELIRELEAQRHEMREILRQEGLEKAALLAENARLAAENQELRGPMGSLGGIAAPNLNRVSPRASAMPPAKEERA